MPIAASAMANMPAAMLRLDLPQHALRPSRRRSQMRMKPLANADTRRGGTLEEEDPPLAAAAAAASEADADPAVPAVGWLWNRKGPLTRDSLRQQSIKPKKSLGQNFMADESVLQDTVRAAALSPGDAVLEVGPGTGALTRHLLAAGALVTAVEKDYGLHDRLAEEFSQVPSLALVCGDILRQDLPALLEGMEARRELALHQQQQQQQQEPAGSAAALSATGGIKVVANLPYNITKEFLVLALPLGGRVAALLLMLQDEAALRLTTADPGGAEWRAINVILRYYSHPRYLFKIDRTKYVPAPSVHGAMVEFRLRAPAERPRVPEERAFLRLVKHSFLQRRKTLRNAMQPLVAADDAVAALAAAGLPPDARAQNLSLDDFVRLAWAVAKQPCPL